MTTTTQPRSVALDRAETDPCERLTDGCCIDHTAEQSTAHADDPCETW